MNNFFKTPEEKKNGLPLPPEPWIDPTDNGRDMPPPGMVWVYTCPKCGDKMYAPQYWNSIGPIPITCRKCGYIFTEDPYTITCDTANTFSNPGGYVFTTSNNSQTEFNFVQTLNESSSTHAAVD